MGRHDDNNGKLGEFFEIVKQLKSITIGQPQIEKDRGRLETLQGLPGAFKTPGHGYGKFIFNCELQGFREVPLVVNDHYRRFVRDVHVYTV